MSGYPTDEELLLRAQGNVAHEIDRALNEAGSVRASVLGHRKPPWPRVLGHRFDGLREVGAQAERDTAKRVSARAVSAVSVSRSASASRETAVWFTDEELTRYAAWLGDMPYEKHGRGQKLYEKFCRVMAELAVLDAGKGAR